MKKVLLINSNTETTPYPVAPIGLSLVASSIQNFFNVRTFDFAYGSTNLLLELVKNYKPDYIGVSIRNIDNVTMQKCKWYIQDIKDKIIDPLKDVINTTIILGGSGFSIAPIELLNFFNVDYGIYGEGELNFLEFLKRFDNKESVSDIKGLVIRGAKFTKKQEQANNCLLVSNADIDKFFDFSPYRDRGNYPIQTKRGCIHKCIYCSYPSIEGNVYRLRPVNNIVDEIEDVHNRLPKIAFEFVDSTFNSPLNHAIAICKEIIRRNLKLNLRTMGVNPGEVTEELISLMKKAGFAQIDCTPDSGSATMIKAFKKNFTKKKLIECAEIIRNNNMPTMWFFMMGAPGETKESILETFEFIDKHIFEEDMVHITEGIRILPNTELFSIAKKEGVVVESQNVIEPLFYVDPHLGKKSLSEILNREIGKRTNVLNSINTAPSKQLMQEAIKYRKHMNVTEPMFRTLLRLENKMKRVNTN